MTDPESGTGNGTAEQTVRVRRSPKIGRFLLVGGLLGLVVALIATLSFPPDGTYTTEQVFAYAALVCIPVGLAFMGTLAVVLDRRSSRRARIVAAQRTETDRSEPDRPQQP